MVPSNNPKFNVKLKRILKTVYKHRKEVYSRGSYGKVLSVVDGLARISGLNDVRAGEMILFSSGVKGMVFSLEEHIVNAFIFANDRYVNQGDRVERTTSVMSIGQGNAFLGRIVNALGEPIDGKGPINETQRALIDRKAPGIVARSTIHEPLLTGIKYIDSLVPIGRGQRELIIGDRQTGKTSICIDTMINQIKDTIVNVPNTVHCVYVAIGQKRSAIGHLAKLLEKYGALEHTTIVLASASEAAPLSYLAPYAGCTIAEYFRDNGRHALIMYDDLTKHAIAYRQMSLLLKRPPGREAFPGDVFYAHSRLLERAAKMSEKEGFGSLTAFPIVETQASDVSAFIPTNVISITDGQIFLSAHLFHNGIRPAVNVGLSVSRVGSKAQYGPIKKLSSSLKLELAQYREMLAFAGFGSDMDDTTREIVRKGQKLVNLLNQDRYSCLSVEQEVLLIFSGINHYLTYIPVDLVELFKSEVMSILLDSSFFSLTLEDSCIDKDFNDLRDSSYYCIFLEYFFISRPFWHEYMPLLMWSSPLLRRPDLSEPQYQNL